MVQQIVWTVVFVLVCSRVVVHDVGILVGDNVVQVVDLLGDAWYVGFLDLELLGDQAGVLADGVNALLLKNAQEVDHVLLCDGGDLEFLDDGRFDVDGREDVLEVPLDEVDGLDGLLVLCLENGLLLLLLLNLVQQLDLEFPTLVIAGGPLGRVELDLFLLLLDLFLQRIHLFREFVYELAHDAVVIVQVDEHL